MNAPNGSVNTTKLTGRFKFVVRSKSGEIRAKGGGKNLVTLDGENQAALALDFGTAEVEPEFLAIGTGSATALKTDTSLQSEIGASRTTATGSTVTASELELTFLLSVTAPWTMREVGIFNNVGAGLGTMFSRFLTQVIDLGIGDTVDFTWTLTFEGVD